MRFSKPVVTSITWCVLVCFVASCSYSKFTELPEGEPIPIENAVAVLHAGQVIVHLMNVEITPDLLKGEIPEFPIASDKEKEIHIYAVADFQIERDAKSVELPISMIEKVETWQKDRGKSAGITILSILGITALTIAVLWLIVMLTKDSCPFVYAFDGQSYVLMGEIFSGATHPPLERDDYLKLPSLVESDGEYRIKITNEVKEIQHTNLAELVVVDHPEDCEVFMDKYGGIHALSDQRPPASAVDAHGKDVLPYITSIDRTCFAGDVFGEDSCLVQKVRMTFDVPGGSSVTSGGTGGAQPPYASLRIRAKNTFWLDYTHKELFSRFGSAYPVWFEQKRHEPASKLTDWSLKQEIPLSVHIRRNGQWEFVDHFNVAGPVAMKDDVLRVDLSGVESDQVEIMLSFGFLFWEIDYVTIDFTGETSTEVTCLKPLRADDPRRGDILHLIAEDDSLYYDQPSIGDEAVLAFGTIPARGGSRSFFLHSKGHYEIIVDTDGAPDMEFLTGFTRPLRFTGFSRELFIRSLHSSTISDPVRPTGTDGGARPVEANESR